MLNTCLTLLVALLFSLQPLHAETPSEAKKLEIDRLHQAMGIAGSAEEYNELKAQWEQAVADYRRLKSEEQAAGDKDAACKSSINSCNSAYKERDYAAAKSYAEAALEACPGNFKALYMLAKSERKLGQFQSALEHLDAAAAAEPGDARPLLEKGEMLAEDMGRISEGLAILDKAVQVDPSVAEDAYYDKGQILLKQKNYEAAAAALEAAVKANANHTRAWIALAHTYVEARNCQQALRACTGALKDNGYRGKSEVYFYQAAAYRMCGQYAKTIEASNACLEDINRLRRNKSYIQGGAHYEKGLALEALERYREAIGSFNEATGFREWKSSATYEIERIQREQGL